MKQFLTIIAILSCIVTLSAQAPQGINYQAVARDSEGKPISGLPINVVIKINDAFSTLYQETHTVPTNNFGLFHLAIGQGSPVTGSFSGINWGSGSKFLEVIIGGTSGGPQPILSVPYALFAEKTNLQAGAGIQVNGNQIINTGDSDNNPSNEIQMLSLNANTLSLSNGGGSVTLNNGPNYSPGAGIDIAGTIISNTGDLSNTNEIQSLLLNGSTLSLSNGGGSVQLPTSGSITIQQGNGISVSQNGTIYTITNSGDTNGNDDIKIGDSVGGDLNGTFPNPTVDGIQGVPVSSSAPQQGQVMMFDNGQWKSAALASQAPNIAIFEERKDWGSVPPPVLSDFSWNKRILSDIVLSSNSVELNGPNIKFNQTGTYLITASAPAFQARRHKLCLKEVGTDVVKITGTSEYTINTASNSGQTTRSFIMGILVVTNTNTQYFLDHYIDYNTGGFNGMGVETSVPSTTLKEVYAQIMIQKIQ